MSVIVLVIFCAPSDPLFPLIHLALCPGKLTSMGGINTSPSLSGF